VSFRIGLIVAEYNGVHEEGQPVFDRISRSLLLAGQCWDVLKEDPSLLLFPLISSSVLLILLGSFALPVFALHHGADPAVIEESSTHLARAMLFIATYGFYLVGYTVMAFFNSALISVVLKRLRGEPATVRDGLRTASENLPAILGYALISATVGTVLRAIEERVGLIGRIVVSLLGAGWTIATAMALPVLVTERVGPIDAIFRSLDLLERNWGENLIGNGGISLGIMVIAAPVFLAASFLTSTSVVGGVMVFGLLILVVGAVSTTLHAIYTAALYRYATNAKGNAGIDGDLLAEAYHPR
jgi:hypothetical protein